MAWLDLTGFVDRAAGVLAKGSIALLGLLRSSEGVWQATPRSEEYPMNASGCGSALAKVRRASRGRRKCSLLNDAMGRRSPGGRGLLGASGTEGVAIGATGARPDLAGSEPAGVWSVGSDPAVHGVRTLIWTLG